jgi:hypothetical protein
MIWMSNSFFDCEWHPKTSSGTRQIPINVRRMRIQTILDFIDHLLHRLFTMNDKYEELISTNIFFSHYIIPLEFDFRVDILKKFFDKYDQRRDEKKYLMTYLTLKRNKIFFFYFKKKILSNWYLIFKMGHIFQQK